MDLTVIASNFIFAPFFAEMMKRSKGIELPGAALGFTPGFFSTKDLLDTLIVTHKKRVFYVGSRFTIEEDKSFVDDYAVRLTGVANEMVSKAEYMKISDALFSTEPHPNANIDWESGQRAVMEPYFTELYGAFPKTLPAYFNGTYRRDSWDYEVLSNFRVALTSNAEQLLVFASYDDFETPDVTLPGLVGDLVGSNQTERLWAQSARAGQAISYAMDLPHRYRLLLTARTLLQHHRAVLTPAGGASDLISADHFLAEVMMLTTFQQMLRFHMCPTLHGPLFDETAALVARLINSSKALQLPADAEEFSRTDALQYIRSMKRLTTRRNAKCGL
jgi:hypothetical protein